MRILANEPGHGPYRSRVDPGGYVEAVGERIALVGRERFEVWMWPLLAVEELDVGVRRPGGSVDLALGARTVHVVPEGLVLEWPCGGFVLRLEAFASRAARALVVLVSVDGLETSGQVEVTLSFRPALRPMWPAGLGGQISGRDPECGAFFLSEELGRFAFFAGSPEADPFRVGAGDSTEADRGVREQVTFRLPISAARAAKGPVPFVFCGVERSPDALTDAELAGQGQSATGNARARAVIDETRELYRAMTTLWDEELDSSRAAWADFLERTAELECSDPALEEAFAWSKIAIERCWARVDGIGRTLVAGLGPSHGGERPGYGWFFNGDALVASRSLSALGDTEGARAILRFAASTQRSDGKIAHEITLSAGLCDWYDDYPYAYYKGHVTPGFVSCLAHHVQITGDVELARELLPTVRRALAWCRTTCDERGCMQVPLAGISAVEAGRFADELQTEVYLQGIWTSALRGAVQLAVTLGESEDAERYQDWLAAAERGLREFWDPSSERLAFARLRDGTLCTERSAYAGLALSRMDRLGDERVCESALSQNHPALATDWGVRMFGSDGEVYEPGNYNTGAVFPYLTLFSVLALFRHGFADAGAQMLRSQVGLDGFLGLGYLPEYLAGDRATAPPRVVPHQVFSQTTIVVGTLFGLMGLEIDGLRGILTIRGRPPLWSHRVAVRGVAVGAERVDVVLERRRNAQVTELTARVRVHSGQDIDVRFEPSLPPASEPVAETSVEARGADLDLALAVALGPELAPSPGTVEPGAESHVPRLVAQRFDRNQPSTGLRWTLAGPAGCTVRIPFSCDALRSSAGGLLIRGGSINDDHLVVTFPAADDSEASLAVGTKFTTTHVTFERR